MVGGALGLLVAQAGLAVEPILAEGSRQTDNTALIARDTGTDLAGKNLADIADYQASMWRRPFAATSSYDYAADPWQDYFENVETRGSVTLRADDAFVSLGKVNFKKDDVNEVEFSHHVADLEFGSSYSEKDSMGRTYLTGTGTRQGLWQTKLNTSLLGGVLKAQGELALGAFDPDVPDAFGESRNLMMRFGLSGSTNGIGYGMNYTSVGKDFKFLEKQKKKLKTDRAGTELWTSWWPSSYGFTSIFRTSHDNLDENPAKPRLTDTEVGLKFDHTLSDWPYVGYSLGYFKGTRTSSLEPRGYRSYEAPVNSMEGGIYFSGTSWDGSWYSGYSASEDPGGQTRRGTTSMWHSMNLTYRPTQSTGITATVGVSDDRYLEYETRSRGRDAGLDFSYAPSDRNIGLGFYVSYSEDRTPAWNTDTQYLYVGGGPTWTFRHSNADVSKIGVDLLYSRWNDNVYAGSDAQDVGIMLRVEYLVGGKRGLSLDRTGTGSILDLSGISIDRARQLNGH